MLKLTNKFKLPNALVRAIANDPYDRGDCDFSVTGLLKPARQAALQAKHKDEIVEDASDRIWSLLGQCMHTVLERANVNEIVETRYYAKFNEFKIGAQIDNLCLESGRLSDYKFTTAWKFKSDRPIDADYVAQLNMQAEILRQNGFEIKELFIIGLLRDWSKLEAQRTNSYPKSQVISLPIPIWSTEQVKAFIDMRASAHWNAKHELPECSPSEMWQKDDTWAVVKKGSQRAVRVFYDKKSAYDYYITSLSDTHDMVHRSGERVRCVSYCLVNKFCNQYQNYLKEKKE